MLDLDVKPYIDRLKDQVSGTQLIAGAAELDRAMTDHVTPPSIFVVYMGATAQPDAIRQAGAHEQDVRPSFDVFICAANVADVYGGAAADALRPWRLAVLGALVGWTPDSAELDPADRQRDRLWLFDDGRIWWRITFGTRFLMRNTES